MRTVRIILFILIAVGLIWLMIILIGKALSGGSTPTTTAPQSLVSYATTDADFVMLIDGPVQSDQTHQSLRITVGRDQNTVELMNGYEGQVVNQASFASNSTAFAAFLKSLDKVGFGRAVSSSISADERGYCPFRNRFVYTIEQDNAQKRRAWTTSCGTGNYLGERASTRRLFINQIPTDSFNAILRGTGMSTQ
jgi:hypothetical protein